MAKTLETDVPLRSSTCAGQFLVVCPAPGSCREPASGLPTDQLSWPAMFMSFRLRRLLFRDLGS